MAFGINIEIPILHSYWTVYPRFSGNQVPYAANFPLWTTRPDVLPSAPSNMPGMSDTSMNIRLIAGCCAENSAGRGGF